MEINILVFGQIADITGRTAFKISGVEDTDELNKKLAELFPAVMDIKYSIAVNRHVVQTNIVLKQDDTVALLPPFSGG